MNQSSKPFQASTLLITKQLMEECDIGPVLTMLEPAKFSRPDLASLCGAVRLRFEAIIYADDLFAKAEGRRFVRELHRSWPWAGYFLRCRPVTIASTQTEIIDAGIVVAWALCHNDELSLIRNDREGVSLQYNPKQFETSLDDIVSNAKRLCRSAGLSKHATDLRLRTIRSTVGSFFALGERQQRKHPK